MAVRKIKNSWWVDFMFSHMRYRKRSPENSRSGAQAYEVLLRQRLARGQSVDKKERAEQRQTLEQFARTWIRDYVVPNLKPSQYRNVRYILNGALIPYFGRLCLDEISGHTIECYKTRKQNEGLLNKTIKNHLSVLNRCLASAYEWLEMEGSPPKIKWPRCDPTEMDFLTFGECELLLSSALGLDHEMILTAVRTGLRQGELKGLQWSSIDWENRALTVRHSLDDNTKMLVSPKSNRIRHLPLDADVYEALYLRKKSTGYVFADAKGPLTHKVMTSRLGRVCRKAGLRRIGWHTLRHTFASHLVMKGVPITVVKELMGHSSVTTTMRYAHLAPSTLRTAIDMLNPKQAPNADFGQPVVNPWPRQLIAETGQEIPLFKNP